MYNRTFEYDHKQLPVLNTYIKITQRIVQAGF